MGEVIISSIHILFDHVSEHSELVIADDLTSLASVLHRHPLRLGLGTITRQDQPGTSRAGRVSGGGETDAG